MHWLIFLVMCFTHDFNCELCKIDYHSFVLIVPKNEDIICSGTLLSSTWVLSSAQCCATKSRTDDFVIVAGVSSKNGDNARPIEPKFSYVEKCYVHPRYHSPSHYNDISLLKLGEPIHESEFIEYAVRKTEKNGGELCDEGYLLQYVYPLKHYTDYNTTSKTLYECIRLKRLKPSICEEYQSAPEKTFCTSPRPNENLDHCQKFNGGPYLCGNVQYGIITGTIVGCSHGFPPIFTEVEKFHYYIKMIMENTSAQFGNLYYLMIFTLFLIHQH